MAFKKQFFFSPDGLKLSLKRELKFLSPDCLTYKYSFKKELNFLPMAFKL